MVNLKSRTRNILLITGGLVLVFLLWFFLDIVIYILLSVILSFVGKPLMWALGRIKIRNFTIPRSVTAFISLISLWLLFFLILRFLVPLLVKEFETFSQINFEQIFSSLQEPLSRFFSFFSRKPVEITNSTFIELIREQLDNQFRFSDLNKTVSFIAGTVGELFIGFFAVSFITFFFLKDSTMFRDAILLMVPTEMEEKVGKILDTISYLLRRYFLGIVLEMILVGVLYTLGLTIIGIEINHAVVIGLFCGLFNIIPYVGPWIGVLTGLSIGLALNVNMDFMSHTLPLLGWMTVAFLLVKVLDDVLFQPLIYSKSVKAHPLEIFLVILAAGSLGGVIGMVLAIPVYTILRVIAKEFFDNLKFVRKITQDLDKIEKNDHPFIIQ
ncbi:MAG: AI-2E family transporter [Prolixibacteraceae bacterium]|jgi:predicted PurR-regulated permease PerM|nr:AI-2E family transporter [Prolixibacteraceae bacterium]HOS00022.1 AI-2E family transporter [Prolixibacteraceae bacterium]HPL45506.1 AI-2E family transporter [Prolixibacteraceae bacterium]HPN77485.1 AI-2E family transporter [Prolixibacteraceae bacterium]